MDLVSLPQIRAAAELLRGVARPTPMVASRVLSERTGTDVHLKCENLQRTGSFKIRGAYTRIHGLSASERARGVVAASAGNHAQGVALAAGLLGARSTVFMPTGAPLPKLAATRAYGAEVHLHGEVLEDALEAAVEFAERTGAVFIHPFEHIDIVAGQGTVGLEIIEALPDVATVLVGAGGGGLVSGVAAAVKALRPDVRVVAVQAEQAAAWPGSLAAGHPVPLAHMATMADGIAVGSPGPVTYAHVSTLVDEVITVSEDALARALVLCLERAKMMVEPAGVAAVAALLEEGPVVRAMAAAGPICAVLSGGNVDPLLLMHVVQHGLAAARRFLALQVTVADNPGSLAALLVTVGATGANVIDVGHSRLTGSLALGQVQIALTLETRGAEHCASVLAALNDAGFAARE